MDIIKRNFFRLLRSGALGEYERLEPMSEFKWNRLLQLLKAQQVAAIAYKGLRNHQFDTAKTFPSTLMDRLEQLMAEEVQHERLRTGEIRPGMKKTAIRLSNRILNHRLKKIRNAERHAIDTSTETLELLDIIVKNIALILNQGISLSGILELGHYLRTKGDRVDFVKLDHWLDRLHIRRMAELEGSILIAVFNFDADELPFIRQFVNSAYPLTLRTLKHTAIDTANEWHFRQSKTGFVRNNSAVLRRNLRRSIRYITYSPIETTSNFMHNFVKSLAEIEE